MSWTVDTAAVVVPLPKPKHSLLPLLVVLFLVSYGLLALLVVEQGRTIDSQRALIQSLFDDSSQLSHMKGKAFQEQYAAAQKAKAHGQTPSGQTQMNQTPKNQAAEAPSGQAPSNQAASDHNAKSNRKAGKLRESVPQMPPAETLDTGDERRIVRTL
jgi:hypothetical protein